VFGKLRMEYEQRRFLLLMMIIFFMVEHIYFLQFNCCSKNIFRAIPIY